MSEQQTIALTPEPTVTPVAVATKAEPSPELSAATIKRLPAELNNIKNCFSLPWQAFRKAFSDPAEADRTMAKEIDFAAQAMQNNPYLVKAAESNPMSLVNALKNVALTGSTLNPVLKQGYLVPFKGSITFMPSYMGLIDTLINNGMVKKVEAYPVFEGEEFDIRLGTDGGISHKPNPWGVRTKDKLQGVYYVATLADGSKLYDTISKDEIEKIRLRAPSSKSSSPWDTDYIEMARKTAIRRAFKMVPKKGISEDKIKALEAVFAYDEMTEQDWVRNAPKPARRPFDEDEPEYEEI